MKKTYITPASEVIDLHAEAPIMAGSIQIDKGEGTATGDEALSHKGGWNASDWAEYPHTAARHRPETTNLPRPLPQGAGRGKPFQDTRRPAPTAFHVAPRRFTPST